jgi:hypothetical protein
MPVTLDSSIFMKARGPKDVLEMVPPGKKIVDVAIFVVACAFLESLRMIRSYTYESTSTAWRMLERGKPIFCAIFFNANISKPDSEEGCHAAIFYLFVIQAVNALVEDGVEKKKKKKQQSPWHKITCFKSVSGAVQAYINAPVDR